MSFKWEVVDAEPYQAFIAMMDANMKYANILSAFFSQPWAILPEKLAEMRAFLRMKAGGDEIEIDKQDLVAAAREQKMIRVAEIGERAKANLRDMWNAMHKGMQPQPEIIAARRTDGVQMIGRVAVLTVFGVIAQRVGTMERASGGVSTEEIGQTLDNLVADKQVKTIVMAFDSPGGTVAGLPELAAKIRSVREQKRVIGLADPMAASAAYWLISQASEVVATPSAQVGSIGVISAHDDITAMLEQMGVKTTVIASSPFKAEGWPEIPLTDEARADMQAKVDAFHSMFVGDIAAGRGITRANVEKNFGKGRMLLAKDALGAGMIDRIATAEQLLGKLAAADGPRAESELPGLQSRLASRRARVVEIS